MRAPPSPLYPDIITSHSPHLQILSCRELGLQHMNLEGDTNTPCITMMMTLLAQTSLLKSPDTYFISLFGTSDFSGGSVVKNPPTNTRDMGSIPGSRRSPGEGNCNPLQYCCLENHIDRGAWGAVVHGVTKSQTGPSNWACTHLTSHP